VHRGLEGPDGDWIGGMTGRRVEQDAREGAAIKQDVEE